MSCFVLLHFLGIYDFFLRKVPTIVSSRWEAVLQLQGRKKIVHCNVSATSLVFGRQILHHSLPWFVSLPVSAWQYIFGHAVDMHLWHRKSTNLDTIFSRFWGMYCLNRVRPRKEIIVHQSSSMSWACNVQQDYCSSSSTTHWSVLGLSVSKRVARVFFIVKS